jgi:hypothetical protein
MQITGAGLEVGDVAAAGLHAMELETAGLGHPARGGEEADPQVEVVPDPQAALVVGLHATAEVLGDLLPGLPVRGERRVGLGVVLRGAQACLLAPDHNVPAPVLARGEADPRLALRSVERVRLPPVDQRFEVLRSVPHRCLDHATRSAARAQLHPKTARRHHC